MCTSTERRRSTPPRRTRPEAPSGGGRCDPPLAREGTKERTSRRSRFVLSLDTRPWLVSQVGHKFSRPSCQRPDRTPSLHLPTCGNLPSLCVLRVSRSKHLCQVFVTLAPDFQIASLGTLQHRSRMGAHFISTGKTGRCAFHHFHVLCHVPSMSS